MGTQGYTAPEVFNGSYFPYDPEKSDLYSLGITIKLVIESFMRQFKVTYKWAEAASKVISIMTNRRDPKKRTDLLSLVLTHEWSRYLAFQIPSA